MIPITLAIGLPYMTFFAPEYGFSPNLRIFKGFVDADGRNDDIATTVTVGHHLASLFNAKTFHTDLVTQTVIGVTTCVLDAVRNIIAILHGPIHNHTKIRLVALLTNNIELFPEMAAG